MAFDSSPRVERTGRPGDRIAALRLILDKIVSARGRLTHDLGNLSEFAEPALD